MTPVRVNDLWSFQTNGELTFSLPSVQTPLRAIVTSPKRYTDSWYSWTGDLVDLYDQPIGRAVFFQRGSKKFGTIDLDDRKFIIRDLNAGVPDDQVLVEVDHAGLPDTSCGTPVTVDPPNGPGTDPPGGPGGELPPGPPDTCAAIVTVLFLHTQQVLDAGRDPEQLSTMGLHALNETINSSAIPNTNLEVVSAGNVLLTSFDDNASDADNAARTVNAFLPTDSLTQALRNQRRADIVILFQETDIYFLVDNINDYDVSGLANINEATNPDKTYSVIEASSAELSKLIVHEVGHLFGCRHRGGAHSFAKGYQICLNPNQFGGCGDTEPTYTVMNPTVGDDTPLRFSNPDPNNLYQGVLAGADTANNAMMISNTACPISQFRPPLFSAFISGPTSVSNNSNTNYLYSSYYHNCPVGPLTYRWEVSWDYGNTFSHLSFTEDAVLAGADVPPQGPKGIVRLTAVCAGDSSIVLLDLTNWSAWNLRDGDTGQQPTFGAIKKKQLLTDDKQLRFAVYPNPTNGTLNIQLAEPLKEAISIDLISIDGRKFSLNRNELTNTRFKYDLSAYPPGFYLLEIRTKTGCLKQPIILTKP